MPGTVHKHSSVHVLLGYTHTGSLYCYVHVHTYVCMYKHSHSPYLALEIPRNVFETKHKTNNVAEVTRDGRIKKQQEW